MLVGASVVGGAAVVAGGVVTVSGASVGFIGVSVVGGAGVTIGGSKPQVDDSTCGPARASKFAPGKRASASATPETKSAPVAACVANVPLHISEESRITDGKAAVAISGSAVKHFPAGEENCVESVLPETATLDLIDEMAPAELKRPSLYCCIATMSRAESLAVISEEQARSDTLVACSATDPNDVT